MKSKYLLLFLVYLMTSVAFAGEDPINDTILIKIYNNSNHRINLDNYNSFHIRHHDAKTEPSNLLIFNGEPALINSRDVKEIQISVGPVLAMYDSDRRIELNFVNKNSNHKPKDKMHFVGEDDINFNINFEARTFKTIYMKSADMEIDADHPPALRVIKGEYSNDIGCVISYGKSNIDIFFVDLR